MKKEKKSRICAICGKKFQINYNQGRKKYCDLCKEMYAKELKKKYAEKFRKTHIVKKKRHINICEVCGKGFLVAQCGREPTKCIDCLKLSDNPIERWRSQYRKDFSGEDRKYIRL